MTCNGCGGNTDAVIPLCDKCLELALEERDTTCPECGGDGFFEEPVGYSQWDGYVYTRDETCEHCEGKGEVEPKAWDKANNALLAIEGDTLSVCGDCQGIGCDECTNLGTVPKIVAVALNL